LKEFNLSLLDKWMWRVLVKREYLWYKVLCGGMMRTTGDCV